MRIGIDFDNTIVDYEGAFHAAAMERGLVTADLPKTKNSVRDFLNSAGRKDDFTALQGYVYGTRMNLAKVYPGFREFVAIARASRNDVFIVSHKTRFPLLGPKYDMHEAARVFLAGHMLSADDAVPATKHFFRGDQRGENQPRGCAPPGCLYRRSSGNPDDAGTAGPMPAHSFRSPGFRRPRQLRAMPALG